MKTKIYLLLIITSIAVWIPFEVMNASWYPVGAWNLQYISHGNCPEDSQPDSTGPTDPGTLYGSIWYPWFETSSFSRNRQARVTGWSGPWIYCQYWDATNPSMSSFSYIDGWTNNLNISLSWGANDSGWAWLKNYDIKIYSSNTPQSPSWGAATTITVNAPNTSYTHAGSNGYAYKFEICPRDNANNLGTCSSSSNIVRLDNTPPDTTNLNNTTSTSLLATTSQAFNFSFNDGGSPVSIYGQIEDVNNPSNFITTFNPSSYAYSFSMNQNISKVDGVGDRWADNNTARQYTYNITSICDQAGNCASTGLPKIFLYNVYANPNFSVANTKSDTNLTDGTAVADGSSYWFTQTILDGYGNAIIPANWIHRTINANLSGISNSMHLNQYSRGGGSAISVIAPGNTEQALAIGAATQTFPNQLSSNDGNYTFQIKAYTPTANAYGPSEKKSDPLASFGFGTNITINDDLIGWAKIFSQTLAGPKFKPLYSASIQWDLRNGWFIEWTLQSSTIDITPNSSTNPSTKELQLEFSGSNSINFDFFGGINTPPVNQITLRSSSTITNTLTTTNLYTSLIQKANTTVNGLSDIQVTSHISYVLDGKSIVYNTDAIGRDGYWWVVTSPLGTQAWVKILWPIASSSVKVLTTWQFDASTSIFSWINRGTIRNNARKAVTLATRNISLGNINNTLTNVTNTSPWSGMKWGKIDVGSDGSVVYIESNGGNLNLQNASSISVTGKRTIIVKGANLYIKSDMYYTDVNSILGIIILKDENGNGGNLYIDPSVTNIIGSYIIDGSVISYNGSEIGVGDISTLKNQLYIYGSMVSENTIGGSRMSPNRCPSLLNISPCTIDIAQKYDLNYLRRYYLYSNKPFGNGKAIWGIVDDGSGHPAIPSNNLTKKITSWSDDLAKYPVVIEYNPVARSSPPPAFDTIVE